MISKDTKIKQLKELKEILDKNINIVFTDFTGLTTDKLNEFKQLLKKADIRYKVTKKSLWPFIFKNTQESDKLNLSEHKGSVAIAYGSGEVNEISKLLTDFSKQEKELTILGGLLNKLFVGKQKIKELASIGSREELLSRLAFILASPARTFVGVLNAKTQELVRVISSIRDKKVE